MVYARYWAASLGIAVCGGFIAIERFAFAMAPSVWIAFGVAIGATVLSIAAFALALLRQNYAFSGLSGLSAFIGGWTVIAMLVFNMPAASWLAFAGGIGLLLVSLRALALHETTVERFVYALERSTARPVAAQAGPAAAPASAPAVAVEPSLRGFRVSKPMRSWMYWLAHAGLELAGALVVLMTFALTAPGTAHPSPRWIAFGIGVAAASVALIPTIDRLLAARGSPANRESLIGARFGGALSAASCLVGIALIVAMTIYTGSTARWLAFALGCGLIGISLVAHAVHEMTSEQVRHELEVAEPEAASQLEATLTGLAA